MGIFSLLEIWFASVDSPYKVICKKWPTTSNTSTPLEASGGKQSDQRHLQDSGLSLEEVNGKTLHSSETSEEDFMKRAMKELAGKNIFSFFSGALTGHVNQRFSVRAHDVNDMGIRGVREEEEGRNLTPLNPYCDIWHHPGALRFFSVYKWNRNFLLHVPSCVKAILYLPFSAGAVHYIWDSKPVASKSKKKNRKRLVYWQWLFKGAKHTLHDAGLSQTKHHRGESLGDLRSLFRPGCPSVLLYERLDDSRHTNATWRVSWRGGIDVSGISTNMLTSSLVLWPPQCCCLQVFT